MLPVITGVSIRLLNETSHGTVKRSYAQHMQQHTFLDAFGLLISKNVQFCFAPMSFSLSCQISWVQNSVKNGLQFLICTPWLFNSNATGKCTFTYKPNVTKNTTEICQLPMSLSWQRLHVQFSGQLLIPLVITLTSVSDANMLQTNWYGSRCTNWSKSCMWTCRQDAVWLNQL